MTVSPTLLTAACLETRGTGAVLGVSAEAGGEEEKVKVGRLKLLIRRETAGRPGSSATWSRKTSQLKTVSELVLRSKSNGDANLIIKSFGGRSDTPLSLHLASTRACDAGSKCAGQRVRRTACAEDIQRQRKKKSKRRGVEKNPSGSDSFICTRR